MTSIMTHMNRDWIRCMMNDDDVEFDSTHLPAKFLSLPPPPQKYVSSSRHGGAVRRVQRHGFCDLDKTLPVAPLRWCGR